MTAGGVVVRWEGSELMLALTNVQDGAVNLTELPRGGIEPGETAEQAARREIFEETGLQWLDLLLPEPLAAHGRAGLRRGIWMECCWYLYLTHQTAAQPKEAAHELLWRPFDRPGPLFWPGERRLLDQHRSVVRELATAALARP
ncbi:NUDIX domain-containing protein [Deinococcus altitudinis]|uniref:NUDIX domain-containing protein n=1 Tax=Deinococcus altitudinis TaxID=468914 RepID=UPI003891CB4B